MDLIDETDRIERHLRDMEAILHRGRLEHIDHDLTYSEKIKLKRWVEKGRQLIRDGEPRTNREFLKDMTGF